MDFFQFISLSIILTTGQGQVHPGQSTGVAAAASGPTRGPWESSGVGFVPVVTTHPLFFFLNSIWGFFCLVGSGFVRFYYEFFKRWYS